MISKPSSNMGHVGSKTRSLGQIEGKSLDATFFASAAWNEILSECLSELYLGQVWRWVILGQKLGQ